MIASAELLADLAALEQAYRTLHPGLYRYNSEASLTALFAEARTAFSTDRSLGDAFLVLTQLTAGLKCGHSYPNFSNQRKAVSALRGGLKGIAATPLPRRPPR